MFVPFNPWVLWFNINMLMVIHLALIYWWAVLVHLMPFPQIKLLLVIGNPTSCLPSCAQYTSTYAPYKISNNHILKMFVPYWHKEHPSVHRVTDQIEKNMKVKVSGYPWVSFWWRLWWSYSWRLEDQLSHLTAHTDLSLCSLESIHNL